MHGNEQRRALPGVGGQRNGSEGACAQPVRMHDVGSCLPEPPAQCRDGRSVRGRARPGTDVGCNERHRTGGELPGGRGGAENRDRQAALLAACREHRHVAAGPAGGGADDQGNSQRNHGAALLSTRATTERVSPPSRM